MCPLQSPHCSDTFYVPLAFYTPAYHGYLQGMSSTPEVEEKIKYYLCQNPDSVCIPLIGSLPPNCSYQHSSEVLKGLNEYSETHNMISYTDNTQFKLSFLLISVLDM